MKKGGVAMIAVLFLFSGVLLGMLLGRFPFGKDISVSYQTGSLNDAIATEPHSEIAPTAPIPGERGKVNINTATVAQLTTLPNIGETLAERIVAYREENGPFQHVEDITAVDGIGQSRFERMKDDITVGG